MNLVMVDGVHQIVCVLTVLDRKPLTKWCLHALNRKSELHVHILFSSWVLLIVPSSEVDGQESAIVFLRDADKDAPAWPEQLFNQTSHAHDTYPRRRVQGQGSPLVRLEVKL